MKKVIILGGSGFFGSYLQAYLERTFKVEGTSASGLPGKIRFDVTRDDTDFLRDYDCVVNCIVSYEKDRTRLFDVNVTGTFKILETLVDSSTHYINISSVSATERNYLANSYSLSKNLTDQVVRYFSSWSNLNLTTLRFAQLYDTAGKARKIQPGLFYFVDKIKAHDSVTLKGNCDIKRSYIPVDIACKCVQLAIEQKLVGEHDVIMPDSYSVLELVTALASLNAYNLDSVVYDPDASVATYDVPACSPAYQNVLDKERNLPYFKSLLLDA